MTTSWIDTPDTTCTSSQCTEDTCSKFHPDTDIAPQRFAFWVKGDRKATYITDGQFATFLASVQELADGEPFQPGEAVVKDLATGSTVDAAEFLTGFAAVAA